MPLKAMSLRTMPAEKISTLVLVTSNYGRLDSWHFGGTV